jgi:hypothetical protein
VAPVKRLLRQAEKNSNGRSTGVGKIVPRQKEKRSAGTFSTKKIVGNRKIKRTIPQNLLKDFLFDN